VYLKDVAVATAMVKNEQPCWISFSCSEEKYDCEKLVQYKQSSVQWEYKKWKVPCLCQCKKNIS